MIRNKTPTSMQKCYDECYLICSTAVYFEAQNNESEALRSWRAALDKIYYHNAYRMPPDYKPKTETERALQDSLHHMELQCKERVTLLEALRESRAEAAKDKEFEGGSSSKKLTTSSNSKDQASWLGNGTVPPVNYSDISRTQPPLPVRPATKPLPTETRSFRVEDGSRVESNPTIMPVEHKPLTPNPPPSLKQSSRTPSPEKKDNRGKLKTTLRSSKEGKKPSSNKQTTKRPPAASKAAGLAWDSTTKQVTYGNVSGAPSTANASIPESLRRESYGDRSESRKSSTDRQRQPSDTQPPTPPPHGLSYGHPRPSYAEPLASLHRMNKPNNSGSTSADESKHPPTPPAAASAASAMKSQLVYTKPDFPTYRSEYAPTPVSQASITAAATRPRAYDAPIIPNESPSSHTRTTNRDREPPVPPASRRSAGNAPIGRRTRPSRPNKISPTTSESADETTSSIDHGDKGKVPRRKRVQPSKAQEEEITPDSSDAEPEGDPLSANWEERLQYVKKNLPKGVDPVAAKQIFNEIVVQGDKVHWDDVAGLDAAKKALKEAVVYPFLRPDLFMGLREPARGMLLFGPPGTGKTMLARAVATESRSTFFAISASSLTSKWLGDSEKLVRALFLLAKALAPSIIFVDEIDSLLSSRGGASEHESTRRIKTEFLIQWSDLQRAAAGKEQTEREKREGDATRVLVLAATNMPWAIDEAARRRFVRRQYIPLPEREVRAEQLENLLSHQKHDLNRKDIEVLVRLTDGYSGSDITALAKDAAMGPLRSLGEALLHMAMDEIRPIQFQDFENSLINIRPSVSKEGLLEFEDWAKKFGERGG